MNRQDVYVPLVEDELTRERVLVMEWMDGVKITEIKSAEYSYQKVM